MVLFSRLSISVITVIIAVGVLAGCENDHRAVHEVNVRSSTTVVADSSRFVKVLRSGSASIPSTGVEATVHILCVEGQKVLIYRGEPGPILEGECSVH
jgi:hypothetical protein